MNQPLTVSRAAEYIGMSLATFNRRKAEGMAPEPANPGQHPAIYMTDDLDAYIRAGKAVDRRKTRWAKLREETRRLEALQAPVDVMA